MDRVVLMHNDAEGSRGGHIIGHTKSGKPIYNNADHPNHTKFSKEEHGEAAKLHTKLYQKAYQKFSNSIGGAVSPDEWKHHASMRQKHKERSK